MRNKQNVKKAVDELLELLKEMKKQLDIISILLK
jgi:hypothetical protein|tara:strand:- start:109 stop:210 length:102 start_codon:yes stop_codon:yes gene_type:complete